MEQFFMPKITILLTNHNFDENRLEKITKRKPMIKQQLQMIILSQLQKISLKFKQQIKKGINKKNSQEQKKILFKCLQKNTYPKTLISPQINCNFYAMKNHRIRQRWAHQEIYILVAKIKHEQQLLIQIYMYGIEQQVIFVDYSLQINIQVSEKMKNKVFQKQTSMERIKNQNTKGNTTAPPIEPQMIIINADYQEPSRFWPPWIFLFILILLIFLLAFARKFQDYTVPPEEIILTNDLAFKQHGISCTNPSRFTEDGSLYCGDNNSTDIILGLVVTQLNYLNRFVWICFVDKLERSNIDAQLKIYEISAQYQDGQFYYKQGQQVYNHKFTLKNYKQAFGYDKYYFVDQGYIWKVMHVMKQLKNQDTDYYIQLTVFNQSSDYLEQAKLQAKTFTKQFTNFTIVIRLVYFCISVTSGFIFLRRYFQLPTTERILQIKLIALASCLLWIFNDCFYLLVIFKPNKISLFFSSEILIYLMVTTICVLWHFFLMRIKHQPAKKATQLMNFTSTWVLAIIIFFVSLTYFLYWFFHTKEEIKQPIIPEKAKSISGDLLALLVLALFAISCIVCFMMVIFILILLQHRQNPQFYMRRHFQFLRIFPIFFVLILSSLIGLAFTSYSAIWILYTYSFINMQVYLLQYFYYTPKVELQKIRRDMSISLDNFNLQRGMQLGGKELDKIIVEQISINQKPFSKKSKQFPMKNRSKINIQDEISSNVPTRFTQSSQSGRKIERKKK